MKVEEFFEEVNIGDYDKMKNIDKVLIDSDKMEFDNYFISIFLYKLNDDSYYCYMAVSNKEESRSNLLNKKFNSLDSASNYYSDLCILGKTGNLYDIRKKLEK